MPMFTVIVIVDDKEDAEVARERIDEAMVNLPTGIRTRWYFTEVAPLEPIVGMPCTVSIGGDRYAHSVAKLLTPSRIELENGQVWSKRFDGRWAPMGERRNSGYFLTLGHAENYRDPSF